MEVCGLLASMQHCKAGGQGFIPGHSRVKEFLNSLVSTPVHCSQQGQGVSHFFHVITCALVTAGSETFSVLQCQQLCTGHSRVREFLTSSMSSLVYWSQQGQRLSQFFKVNTCAQVTAGSGTIAVLPCQQLCTGHSRVREFLNFFHVITCALVTAGSETFSVLQCQHLCTGHSRVRDYLCFSMSTIVHWSQLGQRLSLFFHINTCAQVTAGSGTFSVFPCQQLCTGHSRVREFLTSSMSSPVHWSQQGQRLSHFFHVNTYALVTAGSGTISVLPCQHSCTGHSRVREFLTSSMSTLMHWSQQSQGVSHFFPEHSCTGHIRIRDYLSSSISTLVHWSKQGQGLSLFFHINTCALVTTGSGTFSLLLYQHLCTGHSRVREFLTSAMSTLMHWSEQGQGLSLFFHVNTCALVTAGSGSFSVLQCQHLC